MSPAVIPRSLLQATTVQAGLSSKSPFCNRIGLLPRGGPLYVLPWHQEMFFEWKTPLGLGTWGMQMLRGNKNNAAKDIDEAWDPSCLVEEKGFHGQGHADSFLTLRRPFCLVPSLDGLVYAKHQNGM
jgi:hypothetical protein